jgi:hypothetical protein
MLKRDTYLGKPERQKIFADLVKLQDKGIKANDSRRQIAENYRINQQQLIEIEEEGIEEEWPPLTCSQPLSRS